YADDGPASIAVDEGGPVEIEAVSTLPSDVDASSNAWATLTLEYAAVLSFGPTGKKQFRLDPADQASARQLAVLDADGTFRVLRARGPVAAPDALARGRLASGAPLVLDVRHAKGGAGCRFTFDDWSREASTAPSPTRGAGLPENGIFFSVRGKTAIVRFALADGGAAYRTVAHAAGVYRNRVHVAPVR
ncbi:MAG TPA: hypothetical protein VHB21_27195, partial [Minicystis sp.]|nr:hypothetical protein [Minicystis sp.]